MFKYILVALLALGVSPYASATELTPKDAAALLGKSVVAVSENGTDNNCTATKIGDHQFLSANHCTNMANPVLILQSGERYHVKSALVAAQQKKDSFSVGRIRDEDWAIFNTVEDDKDMPAMKIGCTEEPYLGMAVAYAGFPYPTQYAFAMGHITTLKPVLGGHNNADYGMDVHASPGSSGSAVISMDTGNVIGILTEGIMEDRAGVFMLGFESVKNMDACDMVATTVPAGNAKAPVTDSDDAKAK